MTQTEPSTRQPVVFYSKTGCPWCNAVRRLLDEQGVYYEERNVLQDQQFLSQLKTATRQDTTPTLQIGDEWMLDTDAKQVARKLGLPEPQQVQLPS